MGQAYLYELDIVHGFNRESALLLHLVSEHLIAIGSLFSQVIDYAIASKRACIDTYIGGIKMPCHRYSASGILYGSGDPYSIGQLHLQFISSTLVAFQIMGDSYISHGDYFRSECVAPQCVPIFFCSCREM